MMDGRPVIVIVGGGAAGFFSALSAAAVDPGAEIHIFEKSAHILSKVKISGGGRCNVTHACFDPKELVRFYPRGSRELLGPFHIWQPRHTVEWFESRGVALKTEADGRIFPISDSSETILDCLIESARDLGIQVHTKSAVREISRNEGPSFSISIDSATNPVLRADKLVIATGGGAASGGLKMAQSLGHTITGLAPSLFTFHIEDARIQGLAGLSVPEVTVSSAALNLKQTGALLITHWGLSGPAVLKLSAWGARELAAQHYRFELCVNWTGSMTRDMAAALLENQRQSAGRKMLVSLSPFNLPRRIWERLISSAGIPPDLQYARLNRLQLTRLADELTASVFPVHGKSMNKEEFVTCGGVKLDEVDFKRMESRLVPHLHFAGEVLDIDGVTGGFNFQAAWTTGYIAGSSAAKCTA